MQTIGNYFPFIQEDLKNLCCLATTVGTASNAANVPREMV